MNEREAGLHGRRESARRGGLCLLLAVVSAAVAFATACDSRSDDDATSTPADGGATLSLAVLDDPPHRAALYAIDQRIATSDDVEVSVSYLAQSALDEAVASKQYDVVEAAPLAVPRQLERGLDLLVLSAGQRDRDGTLLVVDEGSSLEEPAHLRGATVAVASLLGVPTLGLRYLLQQRYDLPAGLGGGGVTLTEAPPESMPSLLRDGEIDAALVTQQTAYRLEDDPAFRVLSRVGDELRALTGGPVLLSLLVTYPEVARADGAALRALSALLQQSVTYLDANAGDVIDAVASEQGGDTGYPRWWRDRHDLPLGDLSSGVQRQLLAAWQAGLALGDIAAVPALADVVFVPGAAE